MHLVWELRVNLNIINRDHSFPSKFFQIPHASLPNSAAHRGKFSTYSSYFLWPLNPPNMQYLSPVTATDRYSLSYQINRQYFR